MKTVDTDLQTYLTARKAVVDRNLIWITTASSDTFGFWDGDLDETVSIINPATGSAASRAYKGGGHVVEIPDVVDSPELSIRALSIGLSSASSDVVTMINDYDLRGAAIEWHKGFLDQDTNAFITEPECEFLGFIDGISLQQPAVDLESGEAGEEVYEIGCVSHLRELTRINTMTRSFRAGLERSGDEIFKYSSSVARWKIRWGAGKSSHDGGGSGKPRKIDRPDQ